MGKTKGQTIRKLHTLPKPKKKRPRDKKKVMPARARAQCYFCAHWCDSDTCYCWTCRQVVCLQCDLGVTGEHEVEEHRA